MIKYEHRSKISKPFVNFCESVMTGAGKSKRKDELRLVTHQRIQQANKEDNGYGSWNLRSLVNLPKRY